MNRRVFIRRLGYGTAGYLFIPVCISACTKDALTETNPTANPNEQRNPIPSVIIIGAVLLACMLPIG